MMSDAKTREFNEETYAEVVLPLTTKVQQDLYLAMAYRTQAKLKIAQQKAQEAFRQARDALPEYKEYQRVLETYQQFRRYYERAKALINEDVRESRASDDDNEDIVHEFAEVNQ